MVSGLVIAKDKEPYFSRVKNNRRALGDETLVIALSRVVYGDSSWVTLNDLIMPDKLLEWPVEAVGRATDGL